MEPTYRCRFRYLWRGLKDHWTQTRKTLKASPPVPKGGAAGLLTPFVLLLLIAAVAGLLGPLLSPFIIDHGTPGLLYGTMLLTLAWLLTYPLRWTAQFGRFLRACCQRGWELERAEALSSSRTDIKKV